jgi:hypothetical protein
MLQAMKESDHLEPKRRMILNWSLKTGREGECEWRTQECFFGGGGGSRNSVEYSGQRERGSGGGSPLVWGSTQFSNERNPYSV